MVRALALLIGVGSAGCARVAPAPVLTPVVIQSCPVGPHCVTGQVDDRYATPLAGVRCSVRTEEGKAIVVKTDKRGFYMIDELTSPPREVRFTKDGYTADVAYLQPVPAGVATRTYATLQQSDEANCSCETAEILSGQPACPEERCSEDGVRETSPQER